MKKLVVMEMVRFRSRHFKERVDAGQTIAVERAYFFAFVKGMLFKTSFFNNVVKYS